MSNINNKYSELSTSRSSIHSMDTDINPQSKVDSKAKIPDIEH
jgi:hypothetical protein